MVPFLGLCTGSVSPKPRDWSGASLILPKIRGCPSWEEGGWGLGRQRQQVPTREHFQGNGLRPLLRPWPAALPLGLCPLRYLTGWERQGWPWEAAALLFQKLLWARLWAGQRGGRTGKDAVCILEELGGEKHTCAGELTSRTFCGKAVEARDVGGGATSVSRTQALKVN